MAVIVIFTYLGHKEYRVSLSLLIWVTRSLGIVYLYLFGSQVGQEWLINILSLSGSQTGLACLVQLCMLLQSCVYNNVLLYTLTVVVCVVQLCMLLHGLVYNNVLLYTLTVVVPRCISIRRASTCSLSIRSEKFETESSSLPITRVSVTRTPSSGRRSVHDRIRGSWFSTTETLHPVVRLLKSALVSSDHKILAYGMNL